jgi:peptide/nickel transport system substrate-binding protein
MASLLRRFVPIAVLAIVAAVVTYFAVLARPPDSPGRSSAASAGSGGHLVAATRSEPRTFNRLVARDSPSQLVSLLLNDRLVRLNHATLDVEPALAERWTMSPDGLTCTMQLRRGVTFSDGEPFTAADVAFTFEALYDEKVSSALADAFKVDGHPIELRTVDAHTIALKWPAIYAPGLRLLSNLPVLPAHKLRAALAAGTLRETWNASTPPGQLAGLGPFVLRDYLPGERLGFVRNPRYWRRDATGQPLPRLDRLTLRVVPDTNTELLRLESGEVDVLNSEVRPDDLPALRRLAAAGRTRLHDLGIGLDADLFWFNLTPSTAAGSSPRVAERPWLRKEFREAVSLSVNRSEFVDAVYLGAGAPVAGPVTPGNRQWHLADLAVDPHDPARARTLLANLGLRDRNRDSILEDAQGRPVRFVLLTQKGHGIRERAAAVLKADLANVGVQVDIVTLDVPALIERLQKGAYDAAYFGVRASDTDPSANLDFWLSRGAFHLWNPGQQTPATAWEREIDGLMGQVTSELDPAKRKTIFDRVQRIFAEHRPALTFAAPNITVATSARVSGAHPGLMYPHILWRPEMIGIGPESASTTQ